ncbi:MAG TPA: hypothetical protein VMJ10_16085 [Kofleriaceae bacterium]|nr:hypothetical protein [Kofleriaceae bacterium]
MSVRRAVWVVVAIGAAWLGTLAVLDHVLADRQEDHVRDRAREALLADATVGSTDLALVRGRLTFADLALHRDDAIGHLALGIDELRCELPPLGAALVDGTCRELAVAGLRLDVSSPAMFQIRDPKHRPLEVDGVAIVDARLTFAADAFVPGVGAVAVKIASASAGPTRFRTPLSWVFAMDELSASVEIPQVGEVWFHYRDGKLVATGGPLGTTTIEVPVQLPSPIAARDGREEIQFLVAAGRDIAVKLAEQRAIDWVQSKLR